MNSKASVASHPIHPMLVPLPIGLWIFSLVCDIFYLSTGNPAWGTVALYTLAGGVVGALLAAVPGLIDALSLPQSAARKIAIWHMGINLAVAAVYLLNFVWRIKGAGATGPFVLALLSVVALAVSGWLGGEMVYVHGVAVAPVGKKSPMLNPEDKPLK